MLSAEHYALEHRAVQQLLDIRQREVSYMTERFNSIGTQSSLIGGFVVAQLTAVQPGGDDNTLYSVKQIFWGSSALSLACSVHCILNSTFAAVWGPGLALRGPTGSVSKAYWAMVSERRHIMIAYVLSLLFFVVQTIMGFYIVDAKIGFSPSSVFATAVMTIGAIYSGSMMWRMSKRMGFSDRDDAMGREFDGSEGLIDPDQMVERVLGPERTDSDALEFAYLEMHDNDNDHQKLELEENLLSSGGGGGGGGQSAGRGETDTEMKSNQAHHTAATTRTLNANTRAMMGRQRRFVHMGYLEKRGKRLGRFKKYFVRLQGTMLFFFDDVNTYQTYIATARSERKKPKCLSLRGYQVLVVRSPKKEQEYCFLLDAMDDGTNKRDRLFRCSSEKDLRGWIESLVAASLVAQ